MSNNIILLGAGGHAKSLIEVIESQNIFKIEGLLDDNIDVGKSILDYPVLGRISDIDEYFTKQINFCVAIGHVKDNTIRKALFDNLFLWKQNIPNIVSSTANVSHRAELGIGSQIMNNAYVGPECKIGKNTIINTNAIIEHGANIGDNCHIASGAVVIGDKVVYDNIFVSANSTVIEDLVEPGVYAGCPARKL